MSRNLPVRMPGSLLETSLRTGALLAAAMGLGRFVYTPILPLMEAQAGLSPAGASVLATANYLGYLIGALLGIVAPALGRRQSALRTAGVALVASLALMPVLDGLVAWSIVRFVAGFASAVMFMAAGSVILGGIGSIRPQLVGWPYGGVGAGIAFSGILVAIIAPIGDWAAAWWAAAAVTAVLVGCGWSIGEVGPWRSGRPAGERGGAARAASPEGTSTVRRAHRIRFLLLCASYFLEGTGYIIAGTFLVAAVTATGPGWLAGSVWIVAGLAGVPACVMWSWFGHRFSKPAVVASALVLQAIGVALPAISGSPLAAMASAALFGGTFVGITMLSIATGNEMRVLNSIAILTAVYGVGQVLGPLVVSPFVGEGYRIPMLIGAGIVGAAALLAGLMRIGYRIPAASASLADESS